MSFSWLRLPRPVELDDDRIHAAPIPGHLNGDGWLPCSAQQRLALAEALVATDTYISERLECERMARWQGIKRNARKMGFTRKVFALCVGYWRYGFVKTTIKFAHLNILGTAVVMLLIVLSYNPTTTVSLPPSSLVPDSKPAVSVLQITDPRLLTDSSVEPGLPLKLSCDLSAYQPQLKVKP